MTSKVVMISRMDSDSDLIETQMEGLDYELEVHPVSSEGEAIEALKGAEIIINAGVPLPREVIEEIDQAAAIVSMGHGFNHIDHEAATDQGIMVVNSAGFCTEEVSNHAILMLLACAKKLTLMNEMVKAGKWGAETRDAILPMVPIDGQTLGLVALGNIGRAVARKANVFGLDVIAYDPYVAPWIAKEYRVRLAPSLEALASESDFISVHAPLNNQTRGLIGEAFFKAMKPTAFIINTCRGPVIDEAAMIDALNAREIAGAGLDVFEEEPTSPNNPLFKMDNVIVTPHSAGTSDRSRVASQLQIGQETSRLLRGMLPMSLVNPEVRHKIEGRPMALNG
ncbi:MAG: C-terminal binding protein [SAR202 cluster bacterium]|nr:C-terminal binding protein [SAR202 cluster bacterium]MDP7412603.1 C-terminal binding protein [SAR202 cluster bacterium]